MIKNNEEDIIRKNIVFLSSSFVNLGRLFAENNPEFDVFLILDRKFPFEIEDIDNFYTFTFDKNKIFEKNREKYFDNLALMINDYNPEFIITSNFTKLIPQSFIDFMKFRNNNLNILNIHHADLRIIENNLEMKYVGLNAEIKQFLDEEQIITTIHLIDEEKMDSGKQIAYSHETTLKELKVKGLIHNKEDILNLRLRNVILSYHERTKVLRLLGKTLDELEK